MKFWMALDHMMTNGLKKYAFLLQIRKHTPYSKENIRIFVYLAFRVFAFICRILKITNWEDSPCKHFKLFTSELSRRKSKVYVYLMKLYYVLCVTQIWVYFSITFKQNVFLNYYFLRWQYCLIVIHHWTDCNTLKATLSVNFHFTCFYVYTLNTKKEAQKLQPSRAQNNTQCATKKSWEIHFLS